jgi:hypothetical protein
VAVTIAAAFGIPDALLEPAAPVVG